MTEIKETETKRQVPIQDIYSPHEAAALLGMKVNRIWELARGGDDPFPLRRLAGMKRGSIVFRDEMLDWTRRNFGLVSERRRK